MNVGQWHSRSRREANDGQRLQVTLVPQNGLRRRFDRDERSTMLECERGESMF